MEMKFKEVKPGMVIHCPTKENAKALLEHLNKLGYSFYGGYDGETYYDSYKEKTCYTLYGDESLCYGSMDEEDDEATITEFSDLIEGDDSLDDSSMTAVEALEWLKKHNADGIMVALFGTEFIDHLVEDFTPEEIVEKIAAYEAEEKPKPVEVEEGWRILVFDRHHNLWSGDYFYPGFVKTREEVESIAKRVAIDCVKQTGEDASWCVINACGIREGEG